MPWSWHLAFSWPVPWPRPWQLPLAVLGTCMLPLLVVGCASKPVEPDWRGDAANALDSFSSDYLQGDSSAAAADFKRARAAMSSTGRFDMVAHAELVRCAVRTASLELGECLPFTPLAADATVVERSYAAYLAGRWQGLDAALLPPQHQPIMRGGGTAALASVADPLSRLVAAGAMLQAGRIAPADLARVTDLAIDTASAQGWRRPLLAWLGVAAQGARAAGDQAQLQRLQRRIDLVLMQQKAPAAASPP